MRAVDNVDTLEATVLDHRPGTTGQHLLDELVDEHDVPAELFPHFAQHRGYTEQPGSVDVMPAGVHHTVNGAPVGDVLLIVNRQRIEICPQGDRAARFAAPERCDHAAASDPGPDFQTESLMPVSDQLRGAYFFERQFRVHVQVAPHPDQVGIEGLEAGE